MAFVLGVILKEFLEKRAGMVYNLLRDRIQYFEFNRSSSLKGGCIMHTVDISKIDFTDRSNKFTIRQIIG